MTIQTRGMKAREESRPRKRGRTSSSSSDDDDPTDTHTETETTEMTEDNSTQDDASSSTEEEEESSCENNPVEPNAEGCTIVHQMFPPPPPSNARNNATTSENNANYHVIDIGEIIAQALSRRNTRKKSGMSDLESVLDDKELIYFHKLSSADRAAYNVAHDALMRTDPDATPMRFKILNLDIAPKIKTILMRKLKALTQMEDHPSGEYHKLHNWMNRLCRIPFGKIIPMPVTKESTKEMIVKFIANTRNMLNTEVYGHNEAKDQIIRIVAQWISNPTSKGNVIGIHGNPGVGKTTLIKEGVCKALGLPFAFIPLGGAGDSSYLDGHSYTYEGSCPGRIVDMLSIMNCMNPVLYFDELDKVSTSFRGKEIINVLIHLTDPSQNEAFQDKYFSEVPINLSKCLVIFTYNNPDNIDPILRDRMITIHTKDYSIRDKIKIVHEHLLASILKDFSLHREDVTINEDVITYIVERIDQEAGVRNLKRALEAIVSNINLEILTNSTDINFPLEIDKKLVDRYVSVGSTNMHSNPSISHLYT